LAERSLLVASHIIPWEANVERRADPTNGLCLYFKRHEMQRNMSGLGTRTPGIDRETSYKRGMPRQLSGERFDERATGTTRFYSDIR
jgi:hypothetical protein